MLQLGVDLIFVVIIIACCAYSCFAGKRKASAWPSSFLESKWLFWVVAVTAFLLRFYRLADVPALDCDEASSMYDAWSVANYGMDRNLHSYPLYFSGLGGGQSPMCIYLLSLVAKVFGYNIFAYRVVFCFAGMVTVFTIRLICEELYGSHVAAIGYVFAAFMPIMVIYSRYCLDCNLMMPFFSLTLLFSVRAIKYKKHYLFMAGLFAGLTLYTYIVAYIVMFVFVLCMLVSTITVKKFSYKDIALYLLPIAVLAVVPLMNMLVQMGIVGDIALGPFSIYRIGSARTADISLSNALLPGKYTDSFKQTVWISNLAVGSLGQRPAIFLFLLPLSAVGFLALMSTAFKGVKDKSLLPESCLLWSCMGFLAVALFMDYFSCQRLNSFWIVYIVLAVKGTQHFSGRVKSLAPLTMAASCLVAVFMSTYLFGDMYYDSRARLMSDNGLHEVYYELRREEPDSIIWIDPSPADGLWQVPHVVTMGVDKAAPNEVYATTVANPDYPGYDKVRVYFPYDEVEGEFFFDDEAIYLISSLRLMGTREDYKSALEEAGFTYEMMGTYLVYRK